MPIHSISVTPHSLSKNVRFSKLFLNGLLIQIIKK